MTTISAQTILRSRHARRPDKVLSTLLLRYPRWIHAELMTHRVFSRNAASSRAIPAAKLIQDVLENPAEPIHWGKNQKGMQADEELSPIAASVVKGIWYQSMRHAVEVASQMTAQGAHKQIVNRILEPYAHITVLVSSTEWSNFLALRDHPDAEPHIAMLAREVRKELDRDDNIQVLQPGEWHMPWETYRGWSTELPSEHTHLMKSIKRSVARCASTSYKTVDGFEMTLEKAIELHDKLVGATPLHASPAEHVAQADEGEQLHDWGVEIGWDWKRHHQHGNFVGFRQYRKMLPGECQ